LHLQPHQAITSTQDSLRSGILGLASQILGRETQPNGLVGVMDAPIALEEARHRVRTRLGKSATAEIEPAGAQPSEDPGGPRRRSVDAVDEGLRLRGRKKTTVGRWAP